MSLNTSLQPEKRKKLVYGMGSFALVALVGIGVFASNNWFPGTDPISGKRTGWFGKSVAKNAPSSWNPLAMPTASPTPSLSKENIYAGSRLLAVEDKNASALPPADLAVWREASSAVWYVMGPGGVVQASAGWGTTGDKPCPGDFDGDGKTDFCVFRPSTNYWYIIKSSDSTTVSFSFGTSGDQIAVADYDGDGKSDAGVFRDSTGYWYANLSSTSALMAVQYGTSGDKPAAADYDGDGKADLTVWRPSNNTFYTLKSSTGNISTQSAVISYTGTPIPGDYDGDGKADYALFHSATSAYFYVLPSSTNSLVSTQFGNGTDVPVPNDYDADGKCDIAVWRSVDSGAGDLGNWFILQSGSSNSLRVDHWGTTGDIPVPAYFRR